MNARPFRCNSLAALLAALATLSVAPAQSNGDAYIAKIPSAGMTSSVTLSTSGATGAPGQTVEIPFNLSITGTAAPTAFQIDLSFDPGKLAFASARVGAQLTSAGKGLSSSVISSGDVRLSTTGTSAAGISNGLVAYASFTLTPQFVAGSAPVTLVNCISGALGGPLATGCTAGTITAFTCDINGDSVINILDVQSMINQALGVIAAVDDLNHDGVVNVADVQKEINAALGLGCPY